MQRPDALEVLPDVRASPRGQGDVRVPQEGQDAELHGLDAGLGDDAVAIPELARQVALDTSVGGDGILKTGMYLNRPNLLKQA